MNIGLTRGAQGAEVARLHRVLTSAGLNIDSNELGSAQFGTSTLEALHTFQRRRGLPERDEIDESLRVVLLEVEQNITININQGSSTTPPPKQDPHHGIVTGTLVDGDGSALADTSISAFALQLRTEMHLGDATTNKGGQYTIHYHRPSALNLVVRAHNALGDVIATSPTAFSAPVQVQINLTTAKDGVIRSLSTYTKLGNSIAAQLHGIALADLKENSTTHELRFLASAVGVPFDDVAYYYIAHLLGTKTKVRDATFFGLFYQGVPASLDAALNNLPDTGIDDTFVTQVLAGVLADADTALATVLTEAVTANVLPASYAAVETSELNLLDTLRVQNAGSTPFVRGKTSLNNLLAAGKVSSTAQTAFIQAYSANNGQLGPTWKALRANPQLQEADFKALNTTLSLGELLTGNLPLITDSLNRLAAGSLTSIQNLALLDENDWVQRITQIDPGATSIPQVVPTDTPAQRIARFAQALATRFSGRYPTTAFAGGLQKSTNSSFAANKQELSTFLLANPTLSFKTSNIDHFLTSTKTPISTAALADLKTAQRLFRISPHYATVEALNTGGFQSAQSVYFTGREPFLAQMSQTLGSPSLAKMAFARAQMVYATALMTYLRYNLSLNGINVAAVAPPAPDPTLIANLPDMQALFGSLDYFECEDCQSVYSPAAYLVDLLQYLSWFAASGGGVTNARDALFLRRPDIQYIALDCNNTNTTLPYIDLVNELLENVISPPAQPITAYDTTGTSAERRALPQQISPAPYGLTATALYPLSLPFDLAFAQTTAYTAALGTTRAALLALFAGNPPSAAAATALATASLGINPEMQAVINGTDGHNDWDRWGLAQHPNPVYDPKTRQPYTPNPGDWVAALSHVPVLLNRTGLSLQQLYQLLEVIWVTQAGVTLQAGTLNSGGVQVLDPDTDAMTFTGLTADVLDRANRFMRLWNASGLQMWELDWALEAAAGGALNDAFLVFLAGAIATRNKLDLPFQEVLTFWMPLETRDVTNHLGTTDAVQPATYTEVFRNPAVLASWSSIFVPLNTNTITAATNATPIAITTTNAHGYQSGMQVSISAVAGNTAANGTFTITVTGPTTFTLGGSAGNGAYTGGGTATGTLSGNVIIPASSTTPTPEQAGITAVLALSANDISAILSFTGAANSLIPTTLNTLLRYQRLASALSLNISDLILWIQLTNSTPFGGAPSDTLEFCRRLTVLQAANLAAIDFDYLLRNQSITASSLTFTMTAATAVLQTIRDAIAKLPPPITTPYTATTIQTIFVTTLAAATSTTANVVTPVLARTGVLPLAASTINTLLAQTSGVDPTQFPQLILAFTSIAKAAALFTALRPSETAFTFAVQNAGTFNWLDPSALPLAPVTASPYSQLEALLNAFKLDTRQPARTPKLFDVLGGWLPPNAVPPDVPTAIGGTTLAVSTATNAAPIAITTTTPHGLQTGTEVTITGVVGNTAANGTFAITVTGANTFTLNNSTGNGAWTGGGTVLAAGQPCIAVALNASVSDVTAIAQALGASTPSLLPASLPGSLADIAMLRAIAAALDVATRYGISGTTLVSLAATPATAQTAATAMAALQAQYAQSAWFGAIQPVEDALRQNRRDALVAYLLGPGPQTPTPPPLFLTTDDIYNYYLIDPEMCSCASMTRLLQGSLAVQQFVQQAFLNLVFSHVTLDMSDSRWDEWSWRQQYRLWQANREVFLYPENYVLPQTRTDASPFFSDLESDLRQGNCDADLAETALQNYLRKLVGIARLRVMSHYNETRPDGTIVLHVFACTNTTPPQWFYRTRTTTSGGGRWNAWQPLNLDIASQHLLPVIWDQKLFLVWPVFKQISERQSDQTVPSSGGGSQSPPRKFWAVEFSMSELSAGQWQAKQTIGQRVYLDTEDSPLAFTFRAKEDATSTLQLQVYFVAIEEAIANATSQDLQNSQISLIQQEIANPFIGPILVQAGVIKPPNENGTATVLSSSATVTLTWTGNAPNQTPTFSVVSASGTSALVSQASLFMPESPLSVTEIPDIMPAAQYVDLSQEPTYAQVATNSMTGSLATPSQYGFSGQDLVYGNYTLTNPGQKPLYVLCATTAAGQPSNVELLATITNPHVIVPPQEAVFDSADPFFVCDPTRTYLVQPTYYTLGSRPQELGSLAYINQWNTRFVFETFYHPYARTLLRELEIGGVPQLMARNLQTNPQAVRGWSPNFNFASLYTPQPPVAVPYPGAAGAPDPGESALDFAVGSSGAYSLYNWEIFYHVPMFVSSLLLQNQQFKDALTWLEYIFNPTDTSGGSAPQRYWQMAPFYAMNATEWTSQQVQNLLTTLAADTQQGISDPGTAAAIAAWMDDPFDPHAVASLRISAYGRATVMAFLNVLIATGDWYYNQYTAEMVSYAEQYYIYASMILGDRPQMLPPPPSQANRSLITYASLKNLDAFSNALVSVENLVVAPEPSTALVEGTAAQPSLPYFPSNGNTLLFCIPPNEQLLAFWDTVAQRLYNIRHCLNLQGVAQPLPLYAPPINPLQLIEAAASGAGFSGTTPPAPIYRFSTYLQKAVELTNDVRAYGALILSALEKQDAETLAVLRANQELDIQTRMLDVKQSQVTEAQDQVTALQNQQAVTQIRYNFYSNIAFMNDWEITAIALQGGALIANGVAVILDMTSGGAHMLPSFQFGAAGFGGSPTVTATFGGENVGSATASWAQVSRGLAGLLSEAGGIASTMGSYQRRMDDWNLQAQLAGAELTQIASQITAANDRLTIANQELGIQNQQINNAQALANFLTNKYTNAQLYNWMIAQLTTVYTQAYQLAFSLAQQAQNAYQYELGSGDTFIQFGYWDNQHKGLTAGESLLFDLRRMESQYLAANSREVELTKHISLALTDPTALVLLRETGTCQIALDETLFDADYPGQYFRRLRTVALTIPCVTGPYTGVNATLSLTSAMLRTQAPASPYKPQSAGASAPVDPSVVYSPATATGAATIATSNAQNDAGLFEVNLHDERWLPFEGQGAISTWNLVLDPRDNNFDFTTVTDVILHVRYTARGAGDQAAAANVRAALKPNAPRTILISVRNTFGDAFYTLFNPTSAAATNQTLTLPLTANVFPFSNLGTGAVKISDISFFVVLTVAAAGNNIPATLSLNGGAATNLNFVPGTQQTNSGNPIAALTADAPISPVAATPQTMVVSVPIATIPAGLATTVGGQTRLDPSKIEDILLVVTYAIA